VRKMNSRGTSSSAHAGTAIVVAILLIFSLSGTAGSTPPPPSYILGPGDLLEVSVWGYPDLTRLSAVAPDGVIALPLVGSIAADRLSVERLTELLTKAYAEYIVNPRLVVTVKEYRKVHVSLLGQVTRPGAYDLPLGTSLLDLLAAGGGPTEAAALKEAQFLRPGQPPLLVDLTRAMAGEAALNVRLTGGETLVVPEDLVGFVTVQGEVTRPGRYRLKGEMRLLDVLSMAGGLTERASVTLASLTRGPKSTQASVAAVPKTEPLVLDGLLLRQEMDRNLILQPGDIIIVPEELNNKIYVIGDVKKPGVFPMKGELTLLQAIAMAGGPEERGMGTAKSAFVVRRNGNPQQEVAAGPAKVSALPNGRALVTVDLAAVMHDPSRDVPVQPGDVVVVPITGFGSFQIITSILGGLFHIFR
jgi:polysaccharide biosynthesis/export protein